jgi:glycosyltransferase involved in cell wall biosynthesis
MISTPHLILLGIRGLPAAHGGFETFAERLALFLRARGWRVTVYCQGSATGRREVDQWNGITRVHLPVVRDGPFGTIEFDVKCVIDLQRLDGLILTLGYNTGFLSVWLRLRGRRNYINMDGLEWKRIKYAWHCRAYLWVNERLAAWSGTGLIADHPVIADHLATRAPRRKISVIAYGADRVEGGSADLLAPLGIAPNRFFTLIARPEPENSILELVQAFSAEPRNAKLVVLGTYDRSHPYHAQVLDAAGPEVLFPGAIYDRAVLAALRFHSIAYLHGHRVGGTNPSLVEALGAGNPVIAHDNAFNRWVAGDAALYFQDRSSCAAHIARLCGDEGPLERMRAAARARWAQGFSWDGILQRYDEFLSSAWHHAFPER